VDEWQSAEERNSREKISRARQAAEDLFRRESPAADQQVSDPQVSESTPKDGPPAEQQPRRQPRIFTIPARLPTSGPAEPPRPAQPVRRRAVARRPAGTVPPTQIGRVRTLATYGMTPAQVAELYGVTTEEINRILKAPVYSGKSR
jgi:hypothetical protein